mmetsp:Transcript_14280/g.21094  ORF Transcript_14280/g.21094 Transcript_14280/m.21094 type:complete len:176 (+) Transcript_14280:65-592(+)
MRQLKLLCVLLLSSSASSFLGISCRHSRTSTFSLEFQKFPIFPKQEFAPLFEANNLDSEPSKEITAYSDDCFGLIFLSSTFAFQDYVFGGVFFILSLVGVISFNMDDLSCYQQKAPAVVSVLTLVIIFLTRTWLTDTINFNFPEVLSSAPLAEYLFCSVSILNSILRKDANQPLI